MVLSQELHLGVDADGYVVAETLTQNTVDDADMFPDLLGQVEAPLRRLTCDDGIVRLRVTIADWWDDD